jgi:hypothetical protein
MAWRSPVSGHLADAVTTQSMRVDRPARTYSVRFDRRAQQSQRGERSM